MTEHNTFHNSTVRHGTHSGWRQHQHLKEQPCPPCWQAKSDYDKRRLQATKKQNKNRELSRAQGRATTRLRHKHPKDWAELYEQAKQEITQENNPTP